MARRHRRKSAANCGVGVAAEPPIRLVESTEVVLQRAVQQIHQGLGLLWHTHERNPLAEIRLMHGQETPAIDRWRAATRYVGRMKISLASPEAWKRVLELAQDEDTDPHRLLQRAIFPRSAILAAQSIEDLQYVRLGDAWITDHGQKARVRPRHSLTFRQYLRWFDQAVYREADHVLLEPCTDGDALGQVIEGIDLGQRAAASTNDAHVGLDPPEPLDGLLEAARPSQREILEMLSPATTEKLRAALEMLVDRRCDDAGSALGAQGLTPGALRILRHRARVFLIDSRNPVTPEG